MNNQVSFREVQVYAQKHNIDFNTAAKELGLTEAQAQELASGMSGDANWGKVMDEVTFNPEKADEYTAAAERMAEAEKRAGRDTEPEQNTYLLADAKQDYNEQRAKHKERADRYGRQFWDAVGEGDVGGAARALGRVAESRYDYDSVKDPTVQEAGTFTKVAKFFGVALGIIRTLSSCIENEQKAVIINDNSKLVEAIIALEKEQEETNDKIEITNATLKAILEREIANGATLEQILLLCGENNYVLQRLVDAMIENNKLLTDLDNSIDAGFDNTIENNKKILEVLIELKNSVKVLTEIAADTNTKIPDDLKGDITDIKNAIQAGNMTLSDVMTIVNSLAAKLDKLVNEFTVAGKTQNEIKAILAEIQNTQLEEHERLTKMIELLKSIDFTTTEINNKLNEIKATIKEFNDKFQNDTTISDALNKLLALVKSNNDKADVTNQLLNKLLAIYNGNTDTITKDDIAAIINAIAANSNKIEESNQLLANIQTQNKEFQAAVLEQLKNLGDISLDILNKAVELANGNTERFNQLMTMLAKMQNTDESYKTALLNAITQYGDEAIKTLNQILETNKSDSEKLKQIVQLLQTMQNQDAEFQKAVLAKLNELGETSMNIFNKLVEMANGDITRFDQLMTMLAKMQDQDEKYQNAVLEAVKNLGDTFIAKFDKLIAAAGDNTADLKRIADLLVTINDNISKYGEEGKELGNKILEAIEKYGTSITAQLTQILNVANKDNENGEYIRDLLNKVLTNMDANTQAIIEAMSNIKVDGGGNVDLSGLELMMKELLDLVKSGNDVLTSIDGKMDVITLTIERAKDEILAKMDSNDANAQAILAKLDEFMALSSSNSEAILNKMDTIINILNKIPDYKYDDTALMAKLDDILGAIKDHSITVDITGKVECNCNCGGNHEGIIGDLEDILG